MLDEIKRKALEPDPAMKHRVELPGEVGSLSFWFHLRGSILVIGFLLWLAGGGAGANPPLCALLVPRLCKG